MEQNTLFNTEVSRRYSKALFKVASKENSEQVIYDEVSSLLDLFKSNDIFAKLLLSSISLMVFNDYLPLLIIINR